MAIDKVTPSEAEGKLTLQSGKQYRSAKGPIVRIVPGSGDTFWNADDDGVWNDDGSVWKTPGTTETKYGPLVAEVKSEPAEATDPAFSQPWRVRQSTVSKDFILERPDRRDASGYSSFKFEASRAVLDFICNSINAALVNEAKAGA